VQQPETETKGEFMAINDARRFVKNMKQDHPFRNKALATTGPEDWSRFLHDEDLAFNLRELVEAMAECMAQLESNETAGTSRPENLNECSEDMENRKRLVAPCGLDCGICELYLSRNNEQLMNTLITKGIPKEVLPCEGCRATEGDCPVIHEKCITFECTHEKKISFCSQCDDFPCMKLAPAADRADTLPHNTKLYNLCVIRSRGVEELIDRSLEIKQSYYRGKMEIGAGPKLESTV